MSFAPFRPFDPLLAVLGQGSGGSYDSDAADYFARIVTAGSSMTTANKNAVNAFVVGCKSDGIWSAIKASCLLCAADSLAGALVPLVGTAPTNAGPFVAGDYSRTTGLLGNGTTKYLNSNRANSVDGQNNSHHAVWVNTIANGYYIASNALVAGVNGILCDVSNTRVRYWNRQTSATSFIAGHTTTGFLGATRSASGSFTARKGGGDTTMTDTSSAPDGGNVYIFARNSASGSGSPGALSASRIAFYSIGENLSLAQLDARLTTLMAALT